MSPLLHVDPEDLLVDSFRLGKLVFESGFRPKHMISIWRGGTPIGLGIDSYFRFQGQTVQHTSIATSSYQGIGRQHDVVVKGLEHLVRSVCPEDGLLIIDDVYESGETIRSIVEGLQRRARANTPKDIRVATIHMKRENTRYLDLPVVAVHDLPGDVWIDYPHELGDLVDPDDPSDSRILEKSKAIHDILHGRDQGEAGDGGCREGAMPRYLSARQLVLDSIRLGKRIAASGFVPDFLVALWPGGVWAGLCIHEVYKYLAKKGHEEMVIPDHIPVNTTRTHLSYRTRVIGLDYLAERVENHHKLLVVDTTFRSGRMTSDLVASLKEILRRNLSLSNIRIASVYWNPDDNSTWTRRPFKQEPDFYLRRVEELAVYPHAPHRFVNPRQELAEHNPRLGEVLFG